MKGLKTEVGLDGKPFTSYISRSSEEKMADAIEAGLIEVSATSEKMAETISPAIEDIIRLARQAGEMGHVLSSKFRTMIGPEKRMVESAIGKLNLEDRSNVSIVLFEKFRSPLGKAIVRELFPGCFH